MAGRVDLPSRGLTLSRFCPAELRVLLVGAGPSRQRLGTALTLRSDRHVERGARHRDHTGRFVHREVGAAIERDDPIADGDRGPTLRLRSRTNAGDGD